jgi:HK97 family phage prohead protease
MNGDIGKQLLFRAEPLSRHAVNKRERSIELSFSSEEGVPRWFGREVLLHRDENVDLSRLRNMGSGLLNHNPDIIVGRIEGAKIEDKRGIATLVFDDDEDGEKAFQKVQSGSLRGVSVGYAVGKYREVKADEEYEGIKGPAWVATRWTPYEISLTPIPADSSVGVGRELTRSLEGIVIERSSHLKEEKDMCNCKGFKITAEELNFLMGTATGISRDAAVGVAERFAAGETLTEIQSYLLGLRGRGGSGRGRGKESPKRLDEISDEDFARAFCEVSSTGEELCKIMSAYEEKLPKRDFTKRDIEGMSSEQFFGAFMMR